jgi:ABC-type uncharacterized transport system substrate-binding protein
VRSYCGRFATFLPLLLLLLIEAAHAHPHMWVTLKSDMIFAADGALIAVRYAWSFDEMTSAFATLSVKTQQKGVFTREDLEPLVQPTLLSIKESDYFTSVKTNGTKQHFASPVDCWLDFEEGILTLHFTIPFTSPVRAQSFELDLYDPSYFVDISFAEKAPVTLLNAPSGCELLIARQSWAQAVNKVTLTCRSAPADEN